MTRGASPSKLFYSLTARMETYFIYFTLKHKHELHSMELVMLYQNPATFNMIRRPKVQPICGILTHALNYNKVVNFSPPTHCKPHKA